MDNIIECRLDSTCKEIYTGIWQHDYGQILRITGVDLPKAVEVQFSLRDKGGDTLTRIGTTVDGVTEVKVPDSFLKNENCTQNYLIYAWIYVTDDASGNTEYQIILHVKSRPKPEEPSEEPLPEPNIFHETVEAVNASADRAEMAEQSAKGSAEKAETTLEEIKRVADGISENIENANTMKSELSDTINSAEEKKKELEPSIGKAGEAKTALDSSIRSAGEKRLALDTTVEQANAVDASLKEHIGSAQKIQANVEQIGKNTQAISSLNEDLEEVKDKKITKFYASNQGETHLADSDNGKIQDMIIYGRSSQFTTTGKNLLKYPYIETTKTSQGIMFTDNKDGSINVSGTATDTVYYNLYSNMDGKRLTLASGTYKLVAKGRSKCNVFVNNGVTSAQNEGTFTITDGHNDVWCFIQVFKGLAVDETIYPMIQLASITDESYEPYTGGIPSPSPDYPQEIKSVVNPIVKVCGKNLLQPNLRYNDRVKINIKKGVNLTLIRKNSEVSKGGNLKFEKANGGIAWFGFDKGNVKQQIMLYDDVVAFYYLFNSEPSESYALYIGDENTYEPYTEQSVQLPYTFNAIPVASGGNVTIDGQQWVCDEVDLVRGVKVQRVKVRELSPDDEWAYRKLASGNNNFQTRLFNADVAIDGKPCFCNILPFKNVIWDDSIQNLPKIYANDQEITVSFPPSSEYSSLEAFRHMLTDVKSVIYYILATPIETPLTQEEASAFKQLMTYYPVTNISVTSDQLDGYTVFNYPISMANGWNYVKKQLGDTRDYIYDMDIQSAEAYVNSEYAVALTELEV